MAANLFIDKKQVDTMKGRAIGEVTNGILTVVAGTLAVYLLSATGRDKAASNSQEQQQRFPDEQNESAK